MFEPSTALVDLVAGRLEASYRTAHPGLDDGRAEVLAEVASESLTAVSTCNALYHNVHHTILVTLVGQAILEGRDATGDPVAPADRLNFLVSLLCHDIGYVADLCAEDGGGVYATGLGGETTTLPADATDASLAPHHVDRGILYVHEQFDGHSLLDSEAIAANIDRTRFPVPDGARFAASEDLPGLARAADLLGQVAGPHARRRYPALYYEFLETGVNGRLGYTSPRDLEADFPRFFAKIVSRYCSRAMQLLEATEDGRGWLRNIDAQLEEARSVEGASAS